MKRSVDTYKKMLIIPKGFNLPEALKHEDLEARPLTRDDLVEDLKAVNSSIDIIKKTRGGSWPEEELDKNFVLLDLAWHEREFRDKTSFAYVIHHNGKYIGCFYIYPIGGRTLLDDITDEYDADFSWWVTKEAFEQGFYERVYSALKSWESELPFGEVLYSNKLIPKEK